MANASHVWYFAVISGDARCKALMQPYVEAATSLGESSLWLIRMACCSHNYFYIYTRGFRANFLFPFYLGFVKYWQIDGAWRCKIAVCNLLESLCELWVIPNARVPKTLPCLLWKRCFLGLWHLRVEKKLISSCRSWKYHPLFTCTDVLLPEACGSRGHY